MNVVIIGSGNVASVLGRMMQQHQINILQVVSRDIKNAQLLADKLKTTYCDFTGNIESNADLYIMALSDKALYADFSFLKINNKPIVHTAASVSKNILQKISDNYGVLYPLQTLHKNNKKIPDVPFLIDGNNEATLSLIRSLAKIISEKVEVADDETRLKLHVAAVIVNNLSNHLLSLTESFCKKEHVNFELLKPLIEETFNRILHASPSEVQTGPAKRKDQETIDKHISILNNHTELQQVYKMLSESIVNNQ